MADPVDRGRPPEPGPAPETRLPAVRRRPLPSGVELATLPVPGVPVVVLEAVVRGGSAHDPPGRAGVANLVVNLLPEGAAGLGMLEIAERLADLGATLSVGTSYDAAWVRIVALGSALEPALGLLADLLYRPSFPESEVERTLAERAVDLQRERDEPAVVARNAFAAELYGERHPYGAPERGTVDSIRRLGRESFLEFYRRVYHPANTAVAVVGAIEPEDVESAVEDAFGERPSGGSPAVDVSSPESPGGGTVLVDRPGSAQAQLRVGHLGVSRHHPDHLVLSVLENLFGGSFHSRLNLNLREEKGWTYGIRSAFDFRRGPGPFVIATSVETGRARAALAEIRRELEALVEGPVEPEERDLAVHALVRGLPRAFETATKITDRVREIVVYDLPDDYYAALRDRLESVTVGDLERAAAEHLHPDRLLEVVVADGESVAGELAELGSVRRRPWKPTSADASSTPVGHSDGGRGR